MQSRHSSTAMDLAVPPPSLECLVDRTNPTKVPNTCAGQSQTNLKIKLSSCDSSAPKLPNIDINVDSSFALWSDAANNHLQPPPLANTDGATYQWASPKRRTQSTLTARKHQAVVFSDWKEEDKSADNEAEALLQSQEGPEKQFMVVTKLLIAGRKKSRIFARALSFPFNTKRDFCETDFEDRAGLLRESDHCSRRQVAFDIDTCHPEENCMRTNMVNSSLMAEMETAVLVSLHNSAPCGGVSSKNFGATDHGSRGKRTFTGKRRQARNAYGARNVYLMKWNMRG